MKSIVQELVSVPYSMRPGLKPCEGPKFSRISKGVQSQTVPIGTFNGIAKLRCSLARWQLTHNLVSSDLVWMTSIGEIEALKINSPSGWNPTDKIGMNFIDIHTVLPNPKVMEALPHVLQLVNRGWYERSVWTISPNENFDQRPSNKLQDIELGYGWGGPNSTPVFRYERQYIGPSAMRGEGILFVIDVERVPLYCLSREDLNLIRASILSMTDDVRSYKDLKHRAVLESITRHENL